MEPGAVRAGWLKMLLALLRRTGGERIYSELIATLGRLLAQAEAEAARERQDAPTTRRK